MYYFIQDYGNGIASLETFSTLDAASEAIKGTKNLSENTVHVLLQGSIQ